MIKKLKKKIVFWIDKGLLKDLDAFSVKISWTRSLVIRDAIKAYIKDTKI